MHQNNPTCAATYVDSSSDMPSYIDTCGRLSSAVRAPSGPLCAHAMKRPLPATWIICGMKTKIILPNLSIYFASVPFDRFTIAFHMNENVFFTRMVDSLVEMSSNDPELADGIKWLDNQAQSKGITFYEMIFNVLYQHDMNLRVSKWNRTRN